MPKKPKPARKHSGSRRSRTGCLTCRRRKVRCGEERPACHACQRLQLECCYQDRSSARYRVRFVGSDSTPEASTEQPLPVTDSLVVPPAVDFASLCFDTAMPGQTEPANIADQAFFPDHLWTQVGLGDPDFETAALFNTYWEPLITEPDSGPPPQPEDQSTSSAVCELPVSLQSSDLEPLSHYLDTMVKFHKIRWSQDENLYSSIFSTLALAHPQIFHAMMAWSELHLAHIKHETTGPASERYSTARTLLFETQNATDKMGVTLTTVWFLLQYQLMLAEGTDEFCGLLEYAAQVLDSSLQQSANGVQDLHDKVGPIGMRAICWMTAYDVRACAVVTKAGRLLALLSEWPHLDEMIRSCVQPSSELPSNLAYREVLGTGVRLRIVMGRIITVGRDTESNGHHHHQWQAIASNIKSLRHELESNYDSPSVMFTAAVAEGKKCTPAGPATADHYNRITLLALLYTAILLYQSWRPPSLVPAFNEFDSKRDCAIKIMRLAHHVNENRPNSPQSVWPNIIFPAAIWCSDPIYQSWAIQLLRSAERWGGNFTKCRVLLEACRERQRQSGEDEIDAVSVMQGTTGYFVI